MNIYLYLGYLGFLSIIYSFRFWGLSWLVDQIFLALKILLRDQFTLFTFIWASHSIHFLPIPDLTCSHVTAILMKNSFDIPT